MIFSILSTLLLVAVYSLMTLTARSKMEGVARQMQTCYCMCMCTDRLGGAGVAGTGIGQSNLVADVHVHGGIF